MAVHQILLFLNSAVEELKKFNHEDKDSDSSRDIKIHSFYFDTSVNRTCLLSGERGSGKTSLLKTLFRLTINADFRDAFFHENNEVASADTRRKEIQDCLKDIGNRIKWIDPIDMEVLPGPTNLLAAILCRIEEQIEADRPKPARYSDCQEFDEQALYDLRELMQDVTLAWDGNMPERGEHVDPDTFASEVIRAERARVRIPDRISGILHKLGKRVDNPLYILPIDDFDLNPTRCLELLRLIRMLNVPQLFTIVLGNYTTTHKVLHVKLTGEFAGVAKIQLKADDLNHSIHRDHQSTAADSLRKLIPIGQRIHLRNMTRAEALKFRPVPKKSSALLELMNQIRLTPMEPIFGGSQDVPLSHYLFGVSDEGDTVEETKCLTTSAGIVNDSPRKIADLWFQLQKVYSLGTNDRNTYLFELVKRLLEESVGMNYSEWEEFSGAHGVIFCYAPITFYRDSVHGTVGSWRVDGSQLSVELIHGSIRRYENMYVHTGGEWRFTSEKKREGKVEKVVWPDDSTPKFCLLHDLVTTHQPIGTQEKKLVPNYHTHGIVRSQLSETFFLNWPYPEFSTFIELDIFVEKWRLLIEEIENTRFPNRYSSTVKGEVLYGFWLVHIFGMLEQTTRSILLDFSNARGQENTFVDYVLSQTVQARAPLRYSPKEIGIFSLPLAPEFRLDSNNFVDKIAESIKTSKRQSNLAEIFRNVRCNSILQTHQSHKNRLELLQEFYSAIIPDELASDIYNYLGSRFKAFRKSAAWKDFEKIFRSDDSSRSIDSEDIAIAISGNFNATLNSIKFESGSTDRYEIQYAFDLLKRIRSEKTRNDWYRRPELSNLFMMTKSDLISYGVPEEDLDIRTVLENTTYFPDSLSGRRR